MFKTSSVIVGLEIGTSKVCAMVGELTRSGSLGIIGVGQSRSRGVRKGEIIDSVKAGEDVRNAIVEAEHSADVEINSVFLGVTGSHIKSFNNRGVHPVVSSDRQISDDDVSDVIKNAKAISLSADHDVIHVVRQHFAVDGQEGIPNPVGMHGAKVEADVHVIHGLFNRLQNSIQVVRNIQIEVEDIVFNGLGSSLAVLNNHQKELGSLVIDIGGGSTEYALYSAGIIKHTGVLGVGGDHISNDLAYGLKVPMGRAEQLKIDHGSAMVGSGSHERKVSLNADMGFPEKVINLDHLERIMALRIEEMLEFIYADLYRRNLLQFLRSGVLLTGGSSRISGLTAMAESIFKVPVSLAKTQSVSGITDALNQPEFSTTAGLVKFGSFQQKKTSKPKKGFFKHIFSKSTAIQ